MEGRLRLLTSCNHCCSFHGSPLPPAIVQESPCRRLIGENAPAARRQTPPPTHSSSCIVLELIVSPALCPGEPADAWPQTKPKFCKLWPKLSAPVCVGPSFCHFLVPILGFRLVSFRISAPEETKEPTACQEFKLRLYYVDSYALTLRPCIAYWNS